MIKFDIARAGKKSFSADCKFIHTGCSMPSKLIPGVPNNEGKISFINNGASDTCMLAFQLKGESYLLWEGTLDAGQKLEGEITINLPVEEYPESETINISFLCGYKVSENTIRPTDELGFDIYVQVKKTDWVKIAIIGAAGIGGIAIVGSLLKK